MKCAILKKNNGLVDVAIICNSKGEVISKDINKHLDDVISQSEGLYTSWRITDHLNLPGGKDVDKFDKTFIGAFTDEFEGDQIDVDLNEAKAIAHSKYRRPIRDGAYLPIDGGSMHAVLSEDGSMLRAKVKSADDNCQIEIENASSTEEIKVAIRKIGAIE